MPRQWVRCRRGRRARTERVGQDVLNEGSRGIEREGKCGSRARKRRPGKPGHCAAAPEYRDIAPPALLPQWAAREGGRRPGQVEEEDADHPPTGVRQRSVAQERVRQSERRDARQIGVVVHHRGGTGNVRAVLVQQQVGRAFDHRDLQLRPVGQREDEQRQHYRTRYGHRTGQVWPPCGTKPAPVPPPASPQPSFMAPPRAPAAQSRHRHRRAAVSDHCDQSPYPVRGERRYESQAERDARIPTPPRHLVPPHRTRAAHTTRFERGDFGSAQLHFVDRLLIVHETPALALITRL